MTRFLIIDSAAAAAAATYQGSCTGIGSFTYKTYPHAIWDPHFGQPVVEVFTHRGALGPVNIAYSGVYTIGLRTNEDLRGPKRYKLGDLLDQKRKTGNGEDGLGLEKMV
ncbi:hypothetical protein C1H46_041585 [Malus baccata]|uniref:Uncharacterized protein n=1 Tax=Malus baccata TaxID=106549 RepID=A0A540KFE4_MALBA|nr:hypothetical protein C1H46_041585 [Malus baccata]